MGGSAILTLPQIRAHRNVAPVNLHRNEYPCSKIRSGKHVTIPVLSANYQESATIKMTVREPKKKIEKVVEKKKIEAEIITSITDDQKTPEPIAATISNLPTDKLIISAGKALRKKENMTYDGMARSSQGELGICVSPELIDRALAFMDTLIKSLRFTFYICRLSILAFSLLNWQNSDPVYNEPIRN